jgi:hypothetical protein
MKNWTMNVLWHDLIDVADIESFDAPVTARRGHPDGADGRLRSGQRRVGPRHVTRWRWWARRSL